MAKKVEKSDLPSVIIENVNSTLTNEKTAFLKVRYLHMMNYDCVSINLKSQDKAIFSSKKEACEYFNSHFGDDILADLKEQEKKLSKSCERCRKKENNKKDCAARYFQCFVLSVEIK